MDISNIKLDVTAVQEGVWFTVDKDTKLKIARIGNAKNRAKYEQLVAQHQSQLARGDLKLQDEITRRACIDTVLLGWEGLKEGGKEIPYSTKNAERLLTDEAYLEFQEIVLTAAGSKKAFREEEIAEDAKKSGNG